MRSVADCPFEVACDEWKRDARRGIADDERGFARTLEQSLVVFGQTSEQKQLLPAATVPPPTQLTQPRIGAFLDAELDAVRLQPLREQAAPVRVRDQFGIIDPA